MAHMHNVLDLDTRFLIDTSTRNITPSVSGIGLVQGDKNSEIVTFEMPRYIDGHDMSLCDKVSIHFINVDNANAANYQQDIYTVEDVAVTEDQNNIVFSWRISGSATQYVGSLMFIIKFACYADNKVSYEWNTNIHSGILIAPGLDNGDVVVEEYSDVLEQWYNMLMLENAIVSIEQTATSLENGGLNIWEIKYRDGRVSQFEVRNGSSYPLNDYDREYIINAITGGNGTGSPNVTLATKEYVDSAIGNIESALDGVLAMQAALIGGQQI